MSHAESVRLLASHHGGWLHLRPRHDFGSPDTNDTLVAALQSGGMLKDPSVAAAFQAVDRGHFWLEDQNYICYANTPLRQGHLHLSAPTIYAEALQCLMPLMPGTSFLNVGSGTGYFNSLVSFLTGSTSTNHGIEIWDDVLQHAKQRCAEAGNEHIEYFSGNIYELNVQKSMRYDRMYLGACANSKSKYLYDLLEVGGILVGPFQVGDAQQLRRVVRRSERYFYVEVIQEVQFAPLLEPCPVQVKQAQSPDSERPPRKTPGAGLPGVSFKFSVNEAPWVEQRSQFYPQSFKIAVRTTLICIGRKECKCVLPKEMWTQHIFPWCSRQWFEPSAIRLGSQGLMMFTGSQVHIDEVKMNGSDDVDEGLPNAQSIPADSSVPKVDEAAMNTPGPSIDEDVEGLVEFFDDGRRSIVGMGDDPDDVVDETATHHPTLLHPHLLWHGGWVLRVPHLPPLESGSQV